MFSRRLRSVVPMDPAYLAVNDGSLESAGRGSGLEAERPGGLLPSTPYMQMTFAPLERRLDTAIFRALFASSARQARQFVVHGAVKVNGKKVDTHLCGQWYEADQKQMRYPGYLLNPGDMFQVDPERVMFATGAKKAGADEQEEDGSKKIVAENEDAEAVEETADSADGQFAEGAKIKDAEEVEEEEEEEGEEEIEEDPRKVLKSLVAQSKSVLSSPRQKLGAKQKQDMRAFQKSVKRTLSRSNVTTILTDSLEAQFEELQKQLLRPRDQVMLPSEQKTPSTAPTATQSTDIPQPATNEGASPSNELSENAQGGEDPGTLGEAVAKSRNAAAEVATVADDEEEFDLSQLSKAELDQLREAMRVLQENPIDPSKPYATPWRPRDYMSAFAFIPRYLEVNQNICAAVYLRHPVARPGLAEAPTPFAETTGGSAFSWYLRRR